ncbi:MAG: hypothetical protein JKX70_09970 [Phycisphaerales bacterium]|nr:hypothetical protein [Phycisphaerales bacterium]
MNDHTTQISAFSPKKIMGTRKSCITSKLAMMVIGLGFVLACTGCSTSNAFTPTGNPLLDLRNPELLERDRVQAAEQAWDEVERGVRVRERTRKALKNLAWSNATTPTLRLTVLELLMSDVSVEGSEDSRAMARLLLPTERSPDAVRIMAQRAVDSGWTEMVPALVRSYARVNPNVPDAKRIERAALEALVPNTDIDRIVFEVFLNPSQGLGDAREQAVLRLSQRTRDDAWGLISRLDPSGVVRRMVIDSPIALDAESSSREMIQDLRAAITELGIVPDTAMEIQWLTNLRRHPDKRNQRLNTQWWNQTAQVVAGLGVQQRDGLAIRHLEPIRWASVNRPAWLSLDRDALYGVASERLGRRTHHKRKSQKGENRRLERLRDWDAYLGWGDLLTILVVDDALAQRSVVDQVFQQRTLDKKDTTTEYGGVIEYDAETGYRAVLYRPRSRDRVNDKRFVASDDMFRFSDRSLIHYHLHANKRNNNKFAGPSLADLINAGQSGRTNLVFTSLGKDDLNVDVYFPNGVVIDLGQIIQEK